MTDPEARETRFVYDDLGRQVTVINNCVNGTPSSETGDDDLHTRYVFEDGLQRKMWVDIDGDGTEDAEDQVTTYTYGVTTGQTPASTITVNHLLREVKYPDSASGTDVVVYAYKDLATDRIFYQVDLTYDRNSNITWAEDAIHTGFDVKYTLDDLNRLVMAEEGTESSGSIASRTRQELWTLTQTGNWELFKRDINGNNTFSDTGDFNDDRTHNTVNELTARPPTSSMTTAPTTTPSPTTPPAT